MLKKNKTGQHESIIHEKNKNTRSKKKQKQSSSS